MTLQDSIKNLYAVFGKYGTSDMQHCDCGCIDEEDVKKLASKKLRELEEDDYASYHGSAMYTWGEIEHYKHFLPRILEVHSQAEGLPMIDLSDVADKLEHAKWKSWPASELKAIMDFILAEWSFKVENKESEIDSFSLEEYSFFINFQEVIDAMGYGLKRGDLKDFVHLFYYFSARFLDERDKSNTDKEVALFKKWIKNENLLEPLEEEFFRVENLDSKYSQKVSVVIQMIEGVLNNI